MDSIGNKNRVLPKIKQERFPVDRIAVDLFFIYFLVDLQSPSIPSGRMDSIHSSDSLLLSESIH